MKNIPGASTAAAMDGGDVVRVDELPRPPLRPADAHKGTFGSLLVIAGSRGMSGAACLAGHAALHGGAGLVTVAVPEGMLQIVAAHHPAYMTLPLPEREGRVHPSGISVIEQAIGRQTAVAMGPGLGQSEHVSAFVQHVYVHVDRPLVLDADGLNAFRQQPQLIRGRAHDAPRVLTPHPGEFSRLSGASVAEIQRQRERLASKYAAEQRVVLVLKGPRTVITDGHRLAINPTGNCILAKGGSGDVLTGLIGALLAQGMDAFEAAQLGAYLHGRAGDVLAQQHAVPFPTSLELLACLDDAWRSLSDT